MQLLKLGNRSHIARKSPEKAGDARPARELRALLAARSLVDRMRSKYRELEQLTGAPITLHRAITCIGAQPGIQASELATALGMKRPAISHVLRDLEERGWIERTRNKDDQRSVHIVVTNEGKQLLKATSGKAVIVLQKAMSNLSDHELVSLAGALETLLTHLPDSAHAGQTLKTRQQKARA